MRPSNRIYLPTKHRSFNLEGDKPGKHIHDAVATEYQWKKRTEVDFGVPNEASRL